MAERINAVLDLAFAMDCTGSMDSYITEARDNIIQIVSEVVESEKCEVRLALVEYRDHPPEDLTFVTKKHDFTTSADTMKLWLEECEADGGGDTPEAVADALNDVLNLSWREEATKMCVLVSDAPPHGLAEEGCDDSFPDGCPNGHDPMKIARSLAEKGVSLYVVGCEPSVSPYKDFYLALADVTSGQYVPLADANGLVNIIIYGSREEMSLKKFEAEVEEEIKVLKSSGIAINEEVLTSSLHKKWSGRGEKAKQLVLNNKGLETAKNSADAMKMAKMGFDDVRKHFSTSLREAKKVSGKEEDSKTTDKADEGPSVEPDTDAKIAMATAALASLSSKSKSGDWIKVNLKDIPETVDFGPADEEESSATGTGYQCIDGGITLSQTMRVVNKSLRKLPPSSDETDKL